MKALYISLLALAAAPPLAAQNLILNGDFETHLGFGCMYDRTNNTFTSTMAWCYGFGGAGELDILDNGGGSCGIGLPAISGDTQIGLQCRRHNVDSDAFSMQLSTFLRQGESYRLDFWSHAVLVTGIATETADVEIGLSNDPFSFGTQIFFTAPLVNSWTLSSYSFVAPFDADYVTVRQEAGTESWNHVDAFAIEALPTLVISGTCPGPMTATVTNASVGGTVALLLSSGAGSFTIPNGRPCAGTVLGLSPVGLRLAAAATANGIGLASFNGNVPAAACGAFVQALDLNSCNVSLVRRL